MYVKKTNKTVKEYVLRSADSTYSWSSVEDGNTVGAKGDSLWGYKGKTIPEKNVGKKLIRK